MEKKLICEECNMVFRSAGLLAKHKVKFCVGREVPDLRVQRHSSQIVLSNNGRGIDPRQTRTADLVQTTGQQRTIMRWRSEPESSRGENKPDGAALQNLTEEFHKLRMSIEETLMNTSKRASDTEVSGQQLGHSERLKRMKEMATLHERQLALIHVQHKQLEQQRDELAHQVSVLSEQNSTTHLEALLLELKEQEERNEDTLLHLRQHLHELHVQQYSASADQPQPNKVINMQHEAYELLSSADGPLSAQIKALQHAYVQSGGSDPGLVAQMTDLQAEALSLENNQPAASNAKKKMVKPQQGLSWELLAVEQENRRLEEEILRIQIARDRHRNAAEAARNELEVTDGEKLQREIFSLQAETERGKAALRHSGQLPSPPHPVPLRSKTHTQADVSLLYTRSFSTAGRRTMDTLDSLDPAPYDPVAGLVVFFDLVTGVHSVLKVLRLVAALYSDGREVGTLAPTHPVQCQLGEFYPHRPENYAVLSVKQPVPRLQPSPSLCLVVEVQTAHDLDAYNQEVFKLVACGWAQLELFDQYNQLRSGYWRVPVRSLPTRPSLSPAHLNSLPQVGNMELCVRLVNGRDEVAQSLLQPDPTNSSHYKYPAVDC